MTRSERLQIENEMIFRRRNEKVGEDLQALNKMHAEEGNHHLILDIDLTLSFRCECSDENCAVRIPMLLSEYQKIHAARDKFVLAPDHQVESIEEVSKETAKYFVVKKNHSVPEPSDTLNHTSIDNS